MPTLTILHANGLASESFQQVISFFENTDGFKILVQGTVQGTDSKETLLAANKEWVASFQGKNIKALGLSGADLGIFRKKGSDPELNEVNPGPIFSLLKQEILLVFAPFVLGDEGGLVEIDQEAFVKGVAASLSGFANVKIVDGI